MSSPMPQPTIVMTQPQGESRQTQHPRRSLPSKSVSLLHSPRRHQRHAAQQESDSSSNDSTQIQQRAIFARKQESTSPMSINPQVSKHSSGESSNAEVWFEKSNNQIKHTSNSFANDHSPFFLRNSSSSEEQADAQVAAQRYSINHAAGYLPIRTDLLHLGTDGSSTEDYRGVIDDLTIENKKLKRRLKKYEKLHDSHLKDEKLFEVRIHGLPADKKRELEETLRKFAADLHDSRHVEEFPANGYGGLGALLRPHKTASSSASLQNPDSAYASMSASGQGSAASDTNPKPFAQSAKSRHRNIHTYLHHIPEGLLPVSNPAVMMTERSKKKLVVRRLEQIFAGKGAAAFGHQQALQQQDVSHMAARADRKDWEAEGCQTGGEGDREASIMLRSVDENAVVQLAEDTVPADESSVEQRPTRPLDLDPHRAQIPAENLRYIRHLGFTLPELASASPEDDQGWVYLNLLINMAQLHTINVTSEFVRKAVEELSAKLEISTDGRKIRWQGGRSVTRTSSHGGDSSIGRTADENCSQSPRKRARMSHMDSDGDTSRAAQRQRMISSTRSQDHSRFAYTPLFFHRDSTGDEDSSSEMDDDDATSSPLPQGIGGDSSGITGSAVQTTSMKNKKSHDNGPIIFYSNASFCTDLSGDRKPANNVGGPVYRACSVTPIGRPVIKTQTGAIFSEKRGPLAEATKLPEPMDLADNPIPESLELTFPSPSSAVSSEDHDHPPVNFEVTGIGGVYPADNFSIAVQSRHTLVGPMERAATRSKVLPSKFARILGGTTPSRDQLASRHKHIISTRRKQLQPSSLPPALSYMQNDVMSDDGSDADDNLSILSDSADIMPRMAAPQQIDMPHNMIDESDADLDYDEDDEDNNSDDSSLDLLASAREVDPVAVRAREREYDANMAERFAEEIPAGSSAATAGGGSGFISPASGVTRVAYHKAMQDAVSHRNRLPRMQTNESTPAGGRSSIESEEDEQGSVSS